MGHRKNKKKRKSQPAGGGQRVVYHYSPRVTVIVVGVICLFWIIALLVTQAAPSPPVVLAGLALTVVGVFFCMAFALGRLELDDTGVTILRPFRHKRFKWSELDDLEHAEGYHPPADHFVPARTNVAFASGGTAFTVSNWISRYPKLRDDLRDHLHRARSRG